MRKSIFTKGLIFGIIILFQGVCIPYSIHANQEQVLSLTDFTSIETSPQMGHTFDSILSLIISIF